MSEAKPWDAVFERVRVARTLWGVYDRSLQIRPATIEETQRQWLGWGERGSTPALCELLVDAERRLRTQFPDSYRAFLLRFGPGELENRFEVFEPTGPDRWHNLLDYTHNRRAYFEADADFYDNAEWLCQLVYFGSDNLGDAYAWHPLEVTSTDPHEGCFYHIQRGLEKTPEPAGETFAAFLNWAVAEARARAEVPPEPTNDIAFAPRPLRIRSKPKHSDVQQWLFFNNRTARLIAKSIRDEGRTDAFPILADALQDAGCAHADLLDACRTGDPDIDGKWVLQVLLGK